MLRKPLGEGDGANNRKNWTHRFGAKITMLLKAQAGWWFGIFFIFHNIWDVILPIDFHIFQDGLATTNQQAELKFSQQHPTFLGHIWSQWKPHSKASCSYLINHAISAFPVLNHMPKRSKKNGRRWKQDWIRIQIDNKGMRVKDGDLAEDNRFLPLNSREWQCWYKNYTAWNNQQEISYMMVHPSYKLLYKPL